jgi:uncharacterized membrane protein
VADLLYLNQHDKLFPALVASIVLVAVVQSLSAAGFCLAAGMAGSLLLAMVLLYVTVSITWVLLIWLSLIRDHSAIVRANLYGMLTALLAMTLLGANGNLAQVLGGYAFGQSISAFLAMRAVTRGLDTRGARDCSVVKSLATYPSLLLIGLFFSAGSWADTMWFWFADGISVHPLVMSHPLYDTTKFVGYITVVPALAMNLVQFETSFYEHYRGYYDAILGGCPLPQIRERRALMMADLRAGAMRLVRMQGAVTVGVLVFASEILSALGLPSSAVPMFRLLCLGSLFHVLFLITILLLLYFDQRGAALWSCGVLLVTNLGLAIWSVNTGMETYGSGYALAGLVAMAVAYELLQRSLSKLEFITFARQPVAAVQGH